MANTGLRPAEARNLESRDVHIEDDYATQETLLVIDVRGKTGVGYCKSMPGAVHPFQTLRKRRVQQLKDEGKSAEQIERQLPLLKVFPAYSRDLFNKILAEENLKIGRDGQRRTAYSLRHTYISKRLMEGANIHQIANNCRTSVQMSNSSTPPTSRTGWTPPPSTSCAPRGRGKRRAKASPRNRARRRRTTDLVVLCQLDIHLP